MVKSGFTLYLRYCAGNSVALTCIWMQRVAVLWLAWELSESTFWSSVVLAAQLVPTIIIGPLFGAVADRVRIIPAMVQVQLVLAVLTTSLFVLALADLVTVGVLIVFEILIGITVSAHQPLRMALVPALVPKTLMPRAIALDSMVFNLTRMIGPALAGLLIVIVDIPPVLLLGALGNLVLALVIWSLRNDVAKRAASSGNFLSQLRDGWAVICGSHPVARAFLLTGVFGLGGRAAIDLFPLFAATALWSRGRWRRTTAFGCWIWSGLCCSVYGPAQKSSQSHCRVSWDCRVCRTFAHVANRELVAGIGICGNLGLRSVHRRRSQPIKDSIVDS